MSEFQDKIQSLQEEIEKLQKQYQYVQALAAENAIEQNKIVEQNITIKNRTEELAKYQAEVSAKETSLNEREKQIVIKEKMLIASNKLLDEKLMEFRTQTAELAKGEEKLRKELDIYNAQKKLVDERAFIIKEREEADTIRKNKFRIKEQEIDAALQDIKNQRL